MAALSAPIVNQHGERAGPSEQESLLRSPRERVLVCVCVRARVSLLLFAVTQCETGSAERRHMGERFVVVPVDGGIEVLAEEEHSDAVVAPVNSGGTTARGDEEAAENSVAYPQDHEVLPILEYNREPNKYGMTA